MKAPSARQAPIDPPRLDDWLNSFRFYRHPPNRASIKQWINRFIDKDKDIAARLLDCVEVVPELYIQRGYKRCITRVPGWNDRAALKGRWLIVGFGNAGESGAAMVRSFREATGLTSTKHNQLFCSATDLPSKKLTGLDTVVFVDDFSGTGNQITEVWPILEELIASEAKCYLILTAITSRAYNRVKEIRRLKVISYRTIGAEDDIFGTSCKHFSKNEKTTLLSYCKKADRQNPKGFGDCGLLFVLSHKTPNNSIPILHANHIRWRGLFPRYLNP